MKQFLKFTLATIVGIAITSFLSLFLLFSIIGAIASSGQSQVELKPNSVYQIDLNGTLVDRSEEDPFSGAIADAMGQPTQVNIGLDDLLDNIQKAKTNPNIIGIYLHGGSLSGGIASIREVRNALIDFKKSGKFIIAYADNYSQRMYYLASVANKVLINPQGMLELKGLASENVFFKNTLDKLGIEMQIVKVGTFKSAVEPFINTKMSDANRQQVSAYLTSIWGTLVNEIATMRKIPANKLNEYADEMMMFQPTEKCKQYSLVDELVYEDQLDSIIKSSARLKDTALEIEKIKHNTLLKVENNATLEKSKIAVLYGIGEITDESGEGIVATEFIKTIHELTKDSSIKAVVLRVNSPGGSAYASEQIWRALSLLKSKKPLVVSMGDYAASGGYYISCLADKIVAQPTTITGSIGIFGMIPNINGLNQKLGITYDGVKTNKMSDAITINRAFTPDERNLMQNYVNRGYELFVKRCAEGRKMSTDQIKAIAEGRVWTGTDALKLGLVDKIGSMNDAILLASNQSKTKKYEIVAYPLKESFEQRLLKNFGNDLETRIIKMQLGEQYALLKQIKSVTQLNGVQARLPYDIVFK